MGTLGSFSRHFSKLADQNTTIIFKYSIIRDIKDGVLNQQAFVYGTKPEEWKVLDLELLQLNSNSFSVVNSTALK